MQCVSEDQGPVGEETVHGRRGVVVGARERRHRQLQLRRKRSRSCFSSWVPLLVGCS